LIRQDGSSMDRTVKDHRRRNFWIAMAVLLCVSAVPLVYLYPSISRWAGAARSVELSRLRLGEVTRGDLLREVSVQGKIVATDHPTLVSPAQGVISLLVKAGDVLEEGAVMARIDSPELQNRLQQEQSILLSMKSDVERQVIFNRQSDLQNQQQVALLELKQKAGEKALERARQLFEEGLGSSIDYEKAKDDLQVITLELAHNRQKAKLAKEIMDFEAKTKELELNRQKLIVSDLERRVTELAVLSPVGGLVSRVDVRDKDTVQANQALFSVVDLSKFEVEILIPENYAPEIGSGTAAAVQYEGRDYPAEVKSLSPEVESSQVKGMVVFSGEAPSGLKQNQRVSTRLILDARTDVIKVPRGPFLESMGGRQVYVVENRVATLRSIRVGAISVTEVEIVSGLSPGETIVLSDLTQYEGTPKILLRD
jgi:HlyD family secretion protein